MFSTVVVAEGLKFSTSSLTILPLSPDPLTKFISIFFSFAIFLASGDAKTLEFSLFGDGSVTNSDFISVVLEIKLEHQFFQFYHLALDLLQNYQQLFENQN